MRKRDSQESQAENANQHILLTFGQLQLPQSRQRQRKDSHIRHDIARGIDVPLRYVWNTRGTFDNGHPEPKRADGSADEDAHQDLGEGPAPDDENGDEINDAHMLDGQNAVVLEEKRELEEEEGAAVHDDGNVKVSKVQGNIVLFHDRDVPSQAKGCHVADGDG